jgi:hypothetical protein
MLTFTKTTKSNLLWRGINSIPARFLLFGSEEGMLNGIWCRDPQFVRRLTLWRRGGELVTDRMNVTNLGEVKGICNGGFFSLRDLTLIGHVGIGNTWVGNDIVRRDRLDRYAFGMMGAGRDFDFNILPMDVSQREDGNYVHSSLLVLDKTILMVLVGLVCWLITVKDNHNQRVIFGIALFRAEIPEQQLLGQRIECISL